MGFGASFPLKVARSSQAIVCTSFKQTLTNDFVGNEFDIYS